MEEENRTSEHKLDMADTGQGEVAAEAKTEPPPVPVGEEEEVIDVGGVKEVFDEEGYVAAQDQTLYCVCRQRYVDGVYMVECTECKEWYHPECLNQWPRAHEVLQKYNRDQTDPLPTFTTEQLDKEPAFFCPKCVDEIDQEKVLNKPKNGEASHECGLMQATALAHGLARKAKDLDTSAKTKRNDGGVAVNMTPHKDDETALSKLAAIKERLQHVQRDLHALSTQNRHLDVAVQRADNLGRSATEPSTAVSKGGGEMDCMVCGQPVLPRTFARHIRQCAGKVEELHVPTAVHHMRPYSHPSLVGLQCGQLCRRTGQKEQMVCRRLRESCPLHAVDKKKKAEEADLQLQERDIYLELGRIHNPFNRFFGSTEVEIQAQNHEDITDVER